MNTSKWIGLIVIIIAIFFVLCLNGCENKCTEPITHNVEVVQDEDEVWRIEDENGYDRGSIVLNRRDEINWQSMESDVYFVFPDSIDHYFRFEENLFGEMSREDLSRFTIPQSALEFNDTTGLDYADIFLEKQSSYIERGTSLRLTVREDAPADTIKYEVFVLIADTLVEGNSPPNLIIR